MPWSKARRSSDSLLILVCLAQFMVILDVAIVNVALPSIHDSLGFSQTGLQWVVNAYTLTFAGFLMLGGRACDLFGRRRIFLIGTALFAASSLACALADDRVLLVAARAVQGLGAAIVSAASLAIVTTSFGKGLERNRALGVWGAMAGLGGSAGVLLGGVLTQSLGWPSIFLINVPIGIAVIVAGRIMIPTGKDWVEGRQFDFAGAALISGGLTALVYGVVRSDNLGWGSPGVLLPLLAAGVMLSLFALVEGRFVRDPLIPLRVFRMPRLRAASLIIALLFVGVFSMWFFLSLYLQQVLHQDALQAGLSFLPMTVAIAAASTLAPRLVARFGVRPVLTGGMLLAGAGLAVLTDLSPGGSYLLDVLPGGLLATIGAGSSLVPATIVGVRGVRPEESGLASGILNTSRLGGGTIGLAALTTLATSHANAQLASGAGSLSALSSGYSVAFAAGAACCFAGALAAGVLLREPRDAGQAGELEPA
jgi:EmrB/QacA subfamily drug resistance transporter